MFSKIPTISIVSLRLLIKSISDQSQKPSASYSSSLNQSDPYQLSILNPNNEDNSKFVYAILKLKEQQIFVSETLPFTYSKQLFFDKGQQGLLQNFNNKNQQNSFQANIGQLISTFQLVTVNRGLSNRLFNDDYMTLQIWEYQQMQLLGTYKIHMDLLKQGRTQYSSTFQGNSTNDLISFTLKFQKKQPKGFSTHKQSPYHLNGYYHSPSHFGAQNSQRGSSLNPKNQKPFNPQKRFNFVGDYQTGNQIKPNYYQIPSLRRVGSQQFKVNLPSGRASGRNILNGSIHNNESYTNKYSISKNVGGAQRTPNYQKVTILGSSKNQINSQTKKMSYKNRNLLLQNYRKSTDNSIQSTLKL